MKIQYYYGTTDEDLGFDRMEINDNDGNRITKESVYPLCECPEDAIIGRSLISCSRILDLMLLAYNAGKNGEELTITKGPDEE